MAYKKGGAAVLLTMVQVPRSTPELVGLCYVVQEPLGEMPEVVRVVGRKRGIQVRERRAELLLLLLLLLPPLLPPLLPLPPLLLRLAARGVSSHAAAPRAAARRQILDNETSQTLVFLPWDVVLEWDARMQSEDPEDMELLSVEARGVGAFLFECDDAHEIARHIDAAKVRASTKVQARLLV